MKDTVSGTTLRGTLLLGACALALAVACEAGGTPDTKKDAQSMSGSGAGNDARLPDTAPVAMPDAAIAPRPDAAMLQPDRPAATPDARASQPDLRPADAVVAARDGAPDGSADVPRVTPDVSRPQADTAAPTDLPLDVPPDVVLPPADLAVAMPDMAVPVDVAADLPADLAADLAPDVMLAECATDVDCDDKNVCTSDRCAAGKCERVSAPQGTVCRQGAGACDVAEVCMGSVCPADTFKAANVECRRAIAACDTPEYCTGKDATCPVDAVRPKGALCRSASNVACDEPEYCDGTAVMCPADRFRANQTQCTCNSEQSGFCNAGVCNCFDEGAVNPE